MAHWFRHMGSITDLTLTLRFLTWFGCRGGRSSWFPDGNEKEEEWGLTVIWFDLQMLTLTFLTLGNANLFNQLCLRVQQFYFIDWNNFPTDWYAMGWQKHLAEWFCILMHSTGYSDKIKNNNNKTIELKLAFRIVVLIPLICEKQPGKHVTDSHTRESEVNSFIIGTLTVFYHTPFIDHLTIIFTRRDKNIYSIFSADWKERPVTCSFQLIYSITNEMKNKGHWAHRGIIIALLPLKRKMWLELIKVFKKAWETGVHML